MKKPDKKLAIIIIVIVLIVIASILFFLFKDKLFKPKPTPELDVDKSGNKINWSDDIFPLKQGSSGTKVKELQAALNILKNNNLMVDGKFGTKTLAALQEGFNVTTLSEANYNTYIKPNITAINNYISQSHPSNKGKDKPTNNAPGSTVVDLMGKTVYASKAVKGYRGKKSAGSTNLIDIFNTIRSWVNDKYELDEDQPINYAKDQYIGKVEVIGDDYLQCTLPNQTRVFVPKNSVYPK